MRPINAFYLILLLHCMPAAYGQDIEGLILQNAPLYAVIDQKIEFSEYYESRPPRISAAPGTRVISCVYRGIKCRLPLEIKLLQRPPASAHDFRVQLQIEVKGKIRNLEILPLPKSFPFYEVQGKSVLPNPISFSLSTDNQNCYLIQTTNNGILRFFRRVPFLCGEFRPHLLDGTIYYSFQHFTEGMSKVGLMGPRHLLDEHFNELKFIPTSFDSHEFLLLGLDRWMSFEIEFDRLKGGQPYINKRVRERSNNEIVFDWGISDFISQFKSELATSAVLTSYKHETVLELFHMNSIQRLGEDSLLVGLGQNGVALVNKKTRQVDWVLGGVHDQFSLNIEQQPIFAHTAWLDPKTQELYLFSNQTYGLYSYYDSKIFRYKLDLENKKVLKFEVLKDRIGYTDISGSVQITGDVLSIGMGQRVMGDYDFIEIAQGKETFKLKFKERRNVYRYYRHPLGE